MEQLERDRLITDNVKLVYYIYEKLSKNVLTISHKDDIVSEGMIGLIKAARNFDKTKGCKFATFAARCIQNEMLMFLRSLNKRASHEISLNTPIGKDWDGNELCLLDVLEDEHGNPEAEIDKSVFNAFMDKQKEKDKQLVAAICKGYSQKEIAKKLQVLQPTVSRRLSRLKKRAKTELKIH